MVHLIYPNDPMHPKIRELADTSQFSRLTVREAADYLPEDDAVLDAAIGEAVTRRDVMGFLVLNPPPSWEWCGSRIARKPCARGWASTTGCCSVCNRTASRWWI